MRHWGIILLLVGIGWGIYALNLDVSVPTAPVSVGGFYIPSQRVNNLGLMDARRNHLIMAGILTIVGAILAVTSGSRKTSGTAGNPMASGDPRRVFTTRKCPYSAEVIKLEATVCRFCGKESPAGKPLGV